MPPSEFKSEEFSWRRVLLGCCAVFAVFGAASLLMVLLIRFSGGSPHENATGTRIRQSKGIPTIEQVCGNCGRKMESVTVGARCPHCGIVWERLEFQPREKGTTGRR